MASTCHKFKVLLGKVNTVLFVTGWTTESLLDWGQFIKLGVAGMVMICIEWWSFELGAFLAGKKTSSHVNVKYADLVLFLCFYLMCCVFVLQGTFGEVQLGTYGIVFQWAAFLFMVRNNIPCTLKTSISK